LILGSDEAGVDYKNQILEDLRQDPRVREVIDIGVNRTDAPEQLTRAYVGIAAGEMIRDGHADRAILFCGTGIGVAIAANKVDGIRAAKPTIPSA
jgi:ribose 5-phosphate isomerase B